MAQDAAPLNDLDRYHLVADVIDRVPKLGYVAAYAKQAIRGRKIDHKSYIAKYGDDMPEMRDWQMAVFAFASPTRGVIRWSVETFILLNSI